MNDVWWLRIGIVVAGVVLMAAIWYIGTRPRSGQGRRVTDERGSRTEPTLGQQAVTHWATTATPCSRPTWT